jgi:hypothetical protein
MIKEEDHIYSHSKFKSEMTKVQKQSGQSYKLKGKNSYFKLKMKWPKSPKTSLELYKSFSLAATTSSTTTIWL